MEETLSPELLKLRFYGGRPCLDLINTVEPRHGNAPQDRLSTYGDLLYWAVKGGLLSAADSSGIERIADRDDWAAALAFRRTIELREALYRLFAAIAARRQPHGSDLAILQANQLEALGHARLEMAEPQAGSGARWTWPSPPADLDQIRWLVAADAVELLMSGPTDRVKQCQETCGWLFLDTTRSRTRRWCSMRDCGTEAKVLRQAERRHARRSTPDGATRP
jgi:predicted RNA-binding Zn ribbon-like protein